VFEEDTIASKYITAEVLKEAIPEQADCMNDTTAEAVMKS